MEHFKLTKLETVSEKFFPHENANLIRMILPKIANDHRLDFFTKNYIFHRKNRAWVNVTPILIVSKASTRWILLKKTHQNWYSYSRCVDSTAAINVICSWYVWQKWFGLELSDKRIFLIFTNYNSSLSTFENLLLVEVQQHSSVSVEKIIWLFDVTLRMGKLLT